MTKEHIDAVLDIERRSFTHPWTKSSFESAIDNDSAYFFVACDGEKVVGYIGLETVLDEGSLTMLCVDSEYRKQGIAQKLMNALFDTAVSLKLAFVTLEVRESNIPARSLYAKLGFETVAVRKAYYSKPVENAVLMTKYF